MFMKIKKEKLFIVVTIMLLAIGFAAVTTTLYINGTTNVAGKKDDFFIKYTQAKENGVEKNDLIKDDRHIEFSTTLRKLNDQYVLEYNVTNMSLMYNANVKINCVGGSEYLRVTNTFNTTKALPARTTRIGKMVVTLIKEPFEEKTFNLSCTIDASAIGREKPGNDQIQIENN